MVVYIIILTYTKKRLRTSSFSKVVEIEKNMHIIQFVIVTFKAFEKYDTLKRNEYKEL